MRHHLTLLLSSALPVLVSAQNMWTNGDLETPSNTACFGYSASSGMCAVNWMPGTNVRFLDNVCNIERPVINGSNPGSCFFPNATNPMSAGASGYSAHYFAHRSVWSTGVNTRTFALYQALPANYTSYPFMHFSMNVAALRAGQPGSVQVAIMLDNGSISGCGTPTSTYQIYSATLPCDQAVVNVTWATMFANTAALPSGYTRMLVKVAATRSNSNTAPISVFIDDISFMGASSMVLDPTDSKHEAPMLKALSFEGNAEPTVFPDPATDHMRLAYSFTDPGTATVRILDPTGRVVTQVPPVGGGAMEIPVADLVPGQYVLSITDGDVRKQVRFIRE